MSLIANLDAIFTRARNDVLALLKVAPDTPIILPVVSDPVEPIQPQPVAPGVNEYPIQQGYIYGQASIAGNALDYSGAWIGLNVAANVPFSIPVVCPVDKSSVRLLFLKGNSDVGQARRFTMSWNGVPQNDVIIADDREFPMAPGQRGILTLTCQDGGSFVVQSRYW